VLPIWRGLFALYNVNSVPDFVIKEASSGPIDIVDHGDRYCLYNNGDQWMSYQKNSDSEIKAMYSSYDLASGDVLVSGLGFGILALWLCSKPDVTSVTVVEISEDVIEIFKKHNTIPKKLNLVNDNIITYNTDKKYDSILLDHYEKQNPDWILRDIQKICKRINHNFFWAWSLEALYLFKMYTNFKNIKEIDIDAILKKCDFHLGLYWEEFVDDFFPEEKFMKNISNEKLNNYIYLFFNKEIN
jgi:hypothetical protein